MSLGFRRWLLPTVVVFAGVLAATPALAQTASSGAKQVLMNGVTFDLPPSDRTVAWKPSARPAEMRVRQQTGTEDQGIGVGVLAGINRSQLTGDIIEEFNETKTNFMLGGWVGGNMNGRIGFTGEFIYVFRKNDVDFDGDGAIDDEFSFPAFSIPAVFHINFGPEDRSKGLFYAIVGPVFTFNLTQKVKINGEGDGEDVSEGFNGSDIGILAGGGFEIFRVAFEVRHNWGLRTINTEGDVGDIKTRAWEILVKFRFN
jgi:hypothetical protein